MIIDPPIVQEVQELSEGDHITWRDADGLHGTGVVTCPLTELGYYVVQGYYISGKKKHQNDSPKKVAGLIAVHHSMILS